MTELRSRAVLADAADFGLETGPFDPVYGVVMDMTYPNGVATVVVFADGTTSLYTSTGFGIIGGGGHEQVVRAGQALLRVAAELRHDFAPDSSVEPPPQGKVTIRVLTREGRLAVTEDEQALGLDRSSFSPVFHAAQAVITELRLIDEAAGGRS